MRADAHLDIAWSALVENRGFDRPTATGYLISRESLVESGIGLVFATIFCPPVTTKVVATQFRYSTTREANIMGRFQLGYYRSIGLRLITTRQELSEHVRASNNRLVAAVLLMEGADPIEEPGQVGEWVNAGVRIIGPAWESTRYSGGTGDLGGLTLLGYELLEQMARHGVILDLSHLSNRAVMDVLAVWEGPVIASHSNARAICPGDRQLSDETVAWIGRRNGVIGVSFFKDHLRANGRRPRLDDVVDHIRWLVDVAGSPRHVGLGTDADGLFPASDSPIDSLSELDELERMLIRHFDKADVAGIMGGNWIHFLADSLPDSRNGSRIDDGRRHARVHGKDR